RIFHASFEERCTRRRTLRGRMRSAPITDPRSFAEEPDIRAHAPISPRLVLATSPPMPYGISHKGSSPESGGGERRPLMPSRSPPARRLPLQRLAFMGTPVLLLLWSAGCGAPSIAQPAPTATPVTGVERPPATATPVTGVRPPAPTPVP